MEPDDFLAHYGVKGMKWGRRKAESTGPSSEDHKKVAALRGKRVDELSNNELRTINDRRNLEQNYQRLNPTTVRRGSTAVKAVIGTAGTAIAVYNMVHSPAGKKAVEIGGKAVKNSFNAYKKYRNTVNGVKAITGG